MLFNTLFDPQQDQQIDPVLAEARAPDGVAVALAQLVADVLGGELADLNNLTDITLDAAYSSICGYTERDLDTGASSAAARGDPAPSWCVRPIEAGAPRPSATSGVEEATA